MKNNAQHWQARIPLRVRVLGLFFVLAMFLYLGVLWSRWQLSLLVYVLLVLGVLFLVKKAWWLSTSNTLCFDAVNEFSLLTSNGFVSVYITHVWQSPIALSVQLTTKDDLQKKQLVFWRVGLTSSAWRQLHIYLLRYQLQYQFADLKGAR